MLTFQFSIRDNGFTSAMSPPAPDRLCFLAHGAPGNALGYRGNIRGGFREDAPLPVVARPPANRPDSRLERTIQINTVLPSRHSLGARRERIDCSQVGALSMTKMRSSGRETIGSVGAGTDTRQSRAIQAANSRPVSIAAFFDAPQGKRERLLQIARRNATPIHFLPA